MENGEHSNQKQGATGTGLLFIVAYIAYSAVYVSRVNMSLATPILEAARLITKTQTGLIGSAFFIMYSFGQLLNGPLGDRVRPKFMIVMGLAAIGICNMLIGLIPSFYCILLLWGLNGYAQSMIWGPLLRTIAQSCGDRRAKKLVPFLGSSVAVGSVAGIIVAQEAATTFGVCAAFMIPASITLAAGLIVLALLRDTRVAPNTQRLPFLKLIKQPRVWGMLFPTIAQGVIKDNIVYWAPFFFVEQFGIDIKGMSFYVFIIPLTSIVGRFAYPMLSRICRGSENTAALLCFIFCIMLLIPLALGVYSAVLSAAALALCAAAIAAIDTAMLSIFPLSFGDEGSVSSVVGVMDFATYMGAGISTALYGVLLEKGNYSGMFWSWIAISALSLITLSIYKKTAFERLQSKAVKL